MTKLDWERMDADDIEPQQVTSYDLSAGHVHWDRVTLVTLALGAVAFGVWGHQRTEELARTANVMAFANSKTAMASSPRYPETVALAVLPHSLRPGTAERSSLSFSDPAPNATVGATLTVRGVVSGVPAGKHLWLITQREGQAGFWPKERVVPDAEGTFEQQTWDYGPDGYLSICLLATTDADTARFDEWLAVGDRDDVWPSLQSTTSKSTVLGCQEVKLDKRMSP
jgi:hypothetical protein